jgi:hypothetical protein
MASRGRRKLLDFLASLPNNPHVLGAVRAWVRVGVVMQMHRILMHLGVVHLHRSRVTDFQRRFLAAHSATI